MSLWKKLIAVVEAALPAPAKTVQHLLGALPLTIYGDATGPNTNTAVNAIYAAANSLSQAISTMQQLGGTVMPYAGSPAVVPPPTSTSTVNQSLMTVGAQIALYDQITGAHLQQLAQVTGSVALAAPGAVPGTTVTPPPASPSTPAPTTYPSATVAAQSGYWVGLGGVAYQSPSTGSTVVTVPYNTAAKPALAPVNYPEGTNVTHNSDGTYTVIPTAGTQQFKFPVGTIGTEGTGATASQGWTFTAYAAPVASAKPMPITTKPTPPPAATKPIMPPSGGTKLPMSAAAPSSSSAPTQPTTKKLAPAAPASSSLRPKTPSTKMLGDLVRKQYVQHVAGELVADIVLGIVTQPFNPYGVTASPYGTSPYGTTSTINPADLTTGQGIITNLQNIINQFTVPASGDVTAAQASTVSAQVNAITSSISTWQTQAQSDEQAAQMQSMMSQQGAYGGASGGGGGSYGDSGGGGGSDSDGGNYGDSSDNDSGDDWNGQPDDSQAVQDFQQQGVDPFADDQVNDDSSSMSSSDSSGDSMSDSGGDDNEQVDNLINADGTSSDDVFGAMVENAVDANLNFIGAVANAHATRHRIARKYGR